MDGARFANSVAFLDCHPGDVTWRAGVDVMSFGATKNGALAAEAVVFFDTTLVRDFELRRKQSGHLLSKSRYISAQLLAYVESGLWLRNARRTNELAQNISRAAGSLLMHPVEANEIFLALGQERKQRCARRVSSSTTGTPRAPGETRFVVSWDQREEDVRRPVYHARKTQVASGATRYSSRNPTVTGIRAARTAGNKPPMKPIASAQVSPLHSSSGDTLKANTT
jgi:threonine aldolase